MCSSHAPSITTEKVFLRWHHLAGCHDALESYKCIHLCFVWFINTLFKTRSISVKNLIVYIDAIIDIISMRRRNLSCQLKVWGKVFQSWCYSYSDCTIWVFQRTACGIKRPNNLECCCRKCKWFLWPKNSLANVVSAAAGLEHKMFCSPFRKKSPQ